MEITGLTQYQVDMLNHMWSLDTEEEYFQWFNLLDNEDQILAESLQRLIIEEVMEEELEKTQYVAAKGVLSKFALQK